MERWRGGCALQVGWFMGTADGVNGFFARY